jgi:hypothetical protein
MSRVRDFPDGKTTWLRFRSIAEAAATMQKVEGNLYMPMPPTSRNLRQDVWANFEDGGIT